MDAAIIAVSIQNSLSLRFGQSIGFGEMTTKIRDGMTMVGADADLVISIIANESGNGVEMVDGIARWAGVTVRV